MLKTEMPADHLIKGLLERLELMMLIAIQSDASLKRQPPLTEYVEWNKSLEWAECARKRLGLEPSPLGDPKSPNESSSPTAGGGGGGAQPK